MLPSMRVLTIIAACGLGTCGAARAQSFLMLDGDAPYTDTTAYRVSGDGLRVSGSARVHFSLQGRAARWDLPAGSVVLITSPGGHDVGEGFSLSGDGSVVAGSSLDSMVDGSEEAFVAAPPGAAAGLGKLDPGDYSSAAYGVSADGSVIVGASGRSAFRRDGSGMVALPSVYGPLTLSEALDVSADGSIAVGTSGDDVSIYEACSWTGTVPTGIGFLPFGGTYSFAQGVSPDGTVIVGVSSYGTEFGPSGNHAFKWTESSGMVDLDAGDYDKSRAYDASANGRVIVGGHYFGDGGAAACRWLPGKPRRDIAEILYTDYGIDVGFNTILFEARGVSDDGTVICGRGFDYLNFREIGWVAVLPVPCPSDFNGDMFVSGDDFDEFVVAFEAGDPSADFNGDTFVSGDDFDGFITAFVAGC